MGNVANYAFNSSLLNPLFSRDGVQVPEARQKEIVWAGQSRIGEIGSARPAGKAGSEWLVGGVIGSRDFAASRLSILTHREVQQRADASAQGPQGSERGSACLSRARAKGERDGLRGVSTSATFRVRPSTLKGLARIGLPGSTPAPTFNISC